MDLTQTALNGKNLTIGYGEKTIQKDLDLSIGSGELICLLGQNGVGKSTLLKTLAGLIPSISGELKINNDDLSKLSRQEVAKKLSIVTTEKITVGGLSVMEVLIAGRYPHQTWRDTPSEADFDIISKAIELTGIRYLVEKRMNELSDGQRQKVMIARALIQDGDLILLDEPTAHLDLANRVGVMELLRQISAQGKAVLVSTHELNLAIQFADQLWLMDFGEKLVKGTPEDLALSGDLDRIFHHQDFKFDLITGKVVKEKSPTEHFRIDADDQLKYWIRNAFERLNIAPNESVTIKAQMEKNTLNWTITDGQNTYNGVSIYQLIEHFKKL